VSDPLTPTAESLLTGLDEQQRVAAEALIGPVCMLAGAGTGKTRAITHRIAYGVATGTYTASRVMALTFTSRAASPPEPPPSCVAGCDSWAPAGWPPARSTRRPCRN
jgi:hypothetical protein